MISFQLGNSCLRSTNWIIVLLRGSGISYSKPMLPLRDHAINMWMTMRKLRKVYSCLHQVDLMLWDGETISNIWTEPGIFGWSILIVGAVLNN